MARSILPSTWRNTSRAKAILHRRTRRSLRVQLRQLSLDPTDWDDALLADPPDMSSLVFTRRTADKVNPFLRWAKAITKDLPRESRVAYVRALLPNSVIGAHAISHLTCDAHFVSAIRAQWRPRRHLWLDPGHVAQILRRTLEVPRGHAFVNEVFRLAEEAPRLLGVHDILPFMGRGGDRYRKLLDDLCRALWRSRFNLHATTRSLTGRVRVPDPDWIGPEDSLQQVI